MNPLSSGLDDLPQAPPPGRAWMIIFTDLVSLLLTFFVLMFSMSSVQVDRWKEMVDALSQSLNPTRQQVEPRPTAAYNIATISLKRAINLDYLGAVLDDLTGRDEILMHSRILNLEDRLVIVLPGDVMFDAGRSGLSETGRQALFVLGGVLRNVGNRIGVNGYTDAGSAGDGTAASAWALSLGRAVTVANALKKAGYPDGIAAYGYAGTRVGQLADVPAEARASLAERVDIVILPTVGG